jgi:hypothetical protein
MSDIEREEFEQAVTDRWSDSYSFTRFGDEDYYDEVLEGMWWGWQASRQALSSCSEIPNSSVHASRQTVSVPEWIKCSERLPESGITVLVSNNSGAIYTCRRSVIERKNLEPDGADFTRERFTHWMPLPDPPKQEQSHE